MNATERDEEIAMRLLTMTPEEILLKIRAWRIIHPNNPRALQPLAIAYQLVSERELQRALGNEVPDEG